MRSMSVALLIAALAQMTSVSEVSKTVVSAGGMHGDAIGIWKVGSPHRGNTPDRNLPVKLGQEFMARGLQPVVKAFPAAGFRATFQDAVARGAAPDILVFDNFGVMNGITTALGHFDGIGEDPAVRHHFIKVTGALDDLLGPERGWTYLFDLSPGYAAARGLALEQPRCSGESSAPSSSGALENVASKIAAAYLEGDDVALQAYADADRLRTVRPDRETLKVHAVAPCGIWGNDKLAAASVKASYESDSLIGDARVLVVLRKPSSDWQLLVAARDPVSTDAFLKSLSSVQALGVARERVLEAPIPAQLVAPATGDYPQAASGQRFGSFRWRSSASNEVVAEIVEFAYQDDARLVLTKPRRPESAAEISAGALWTTRGAWYWRVWSVSRAGDVGFSEVRTFVH